MKKILLTVSLLMLATGVASAQLIEFGIGAELGLPASTEFKDAAKTGFGAVVMAKIGLPVVTVTGSVDYLSFGEKELIGVKSSSSMWGINAGGRLSLLPLIYVGAEAGPYFISAKTQITGQPEVKDSETKFAISPMLGISLWKLNVDARYVIMDKANMVVARAMLFL